MAITKVSQYNSSPTVIADYQAQNNYLQALINKANGSMSILNQTDTTSVPYIAVGTYIMMGGTLYIVDTEDYTILGSVASGSNYIALAVSGSNLTATWVQDISSYSWNSIYNYYSDGINILLPYIVNYDSTNYLMGNYIPNLSINTLNMVGSVLPTTTPTYESFVLSADSFWVPERGVYMWASTKQCAIIMNGSGAYTGANTSGCLITDGELYNSIKYRITLKCITSEDCTIKYYKF